MLDNNYISDPQIVELVKTFQAHHIEHATTLADIKERCIVRARGLGFMVDFRQTNFEGELVESVHQARNEACGIIINPAAYTFTSIALLDALKTFDAPAAE